MTPGRFAPPCPGHISRARGLGTPPPEPSPEEPRQSQVGGPVQGRGLEAQQGPALEPRLGGGGGCGTTRGACWSRFPGPRYRGARATPPRQRSASPAVAGPEQPRPRRRERSRGLSAVLPPSRGQVGGRAGEPRGSGRPPRAWPGLGSAAAAAATASWWGRGGVRGRAKMAAGRGRRALPGAWPAPRLAASSGAAATGASGRSPLRLVSALRSVSLSQPAERRRLPGVRGHRDAPAAETAPFGPKAFAAGAGLGPRAGTCSCRGRNVRCGAGREPPSAPRLPQLRQTRPLPGGSGFVAAVAAAAPGLLVPIGAVRRVDGGSSLRTGHTSVKTH